MFRRLLLGSLAFLMAWPAAAAVAYRVDQREIVDLRVDLLAVRHSRTVRLESIALELQPGEPVSWQGPVAWPRGSRSRVSFRTTGRPGADGHPVDFQATVETEGRTFRPGRGLMLEDGRTYLVEAGKVGPDRLVFAFTGQREESRSIVTGPPRVGAPVHFRVEIVRVLGEREVLLESNVMQTFVGEPVSYAFRRGDEWEGERANLELRPLRRSDGSAEVAIALSGSLPDGEQERSFVEARETRSWSDGQTHYLDLVAGDPPNGYSFRVTALLP